ncbi:MAG: hypothetical protein ABF899_01600 [Oenococcus sp.]|uniref:hypothetical protein n=1 Tax=Oenococcus sp. TaxID=1979414 RepID=UPI0039E78A7E
MADEQLNLQNINEDATAIKVEDFFVRKGKSHLSNFDRLKMRSGSSTDDLKSKIWSDMPKGGGSGNSAEDKIISRLDKSAQLDVIMDAINRIDPTFKNIFVSWYVDNSLHTVTWENICKMLNYKLTQSHIMMYRAEVSFAYCYDYHENLPIKTFLVPQVANVLRTNSEQFTYSLRTNT